MVATIPERNNARRVMNTVRDHDRDRRMTKAPHPDTWGCGLSCFRKTGLTHDQLVTAIQLSLDVGGLIITPDGTYAPGWMKPA